MKVTNEMLEQLIAMETVMKDMSEKVETLKIVLKEHGSFSTRDYVVVVEDRTRDSLPGIKEMISALGEKAIKPLIKTSSFKVVKVSKKAA